MAIARYLSMVKFSHTVFALPFALVGLSLGFYATEQPLVSEKLLYVLVCMVTARNAAMGFNRWADRHFDARNARTAVREVASGQISPGAALGFVIVNAALFVAATWFINRLCFYLSPVALLVILGYSYTKRFTALCHLILGVGLGLAPVGAYIAVTEAFALAPIVLGFAVLLWVSGFDIIYALQDVDFDRQQGLNSIPAYLGVPGAIRLSEVLHVGCAALVSYFAVLTNVGPIFMLGYFSFVGLLFYQHRLVRPTDLSRINLAFFTANGIGSVVFGLCTIFDLVSRAQGWLQPLWTLFL